MWTNSWASHLQYLLLQCLPLSNFHLSGTVHSLRVPNFRYFFYYAVTIPPFVILLVNVISYFFFSLIASKTSDRFFFLLVCANLRLKGINDFSHMMNDDVLIPNYIAKLNNTHLHQSLHRRPCLSNNSSNVSSLTP